MIFLADMAFRMSNFDDFDNDQIMSVWKKIDPLKLRQNTRKNENDLADTRKLCTSKTIEYLFLHENYFQILIILADLTFFVSNFTYFDNVQISW